MVDLDQVNRTRAEAERRVDELDAEMQRLHLEARAIEKSGAGLLSATPLPEASMTRLAELEEKYEALRKERSEAWQALKDAETREYDANAALGWDSGEG